MSADTGASRTFDRAVLVDVLVYHWPTKTSGCWCGWAVLGASFPEHVADVYEESVRARTDEQPGRPSCCCGAVPWDGKGLSHVAAGIVHRVGGPCYVIEYTDAKTDSGATS